MHETTKLNQISMQASTGSPRNPAVAAKTPQRHRALNSNAVEHDHAYERAYLFQPKNMSEESVQAHTVVPYF
jgi:hypothetical protein